MRRFALSCLLLAVAACVGPRQPFLYDGKPTIRVARAAMISGAPQVALNVASSILDTKPNDVEAQLVKGDALYALGLSTLAQSSYQEVLKLQPGNASAHLGLGRIKLSDHDPKGAEVELRAALAAQTLPETLSNLGVALDLQQRPSEAQVQYRKALDLDPRSTATRVNLARSLLSTGNPGAAREVLQPAVAAQPNGLLAPDVDALQRTIVRESAGVPDTATGPATDAPDAGPVLAPASLNAAPASTPYPSSTRARAPRAVQ